MIKENKEEKQKKRYSVALKDNISMENRGKLYPKETETFEWGLLASH